MPNVQIEGQRAFTKGRQSTALATQVRGIDAAQSRFRQGWKSVQARTALACSFKPSASTTFKMVSKLGARSPESAL